MDDSDFIAFTVPYVTANEVRYVTDALTSGLTSGDGPFTARAVQLLEPLVGGGSCLLTTSCTHALEMTGLLLDLQAGDEVIVPSFTFVSTVNAFVLRGATPVFVDIRPDTFNLDERLLEDAITPRTKAIVVVHYGGVACDMDAIMAIAERHGVQVIEDNAHGLGGTYQGRLLGSIGSLATQSFHSTKNISCGEGGALVANVPALMERAEIVREKGTNRSQFFRGMVDKYRWVDVGSSYLPSDVLAAALCAQLESFEEIQTRRHAIWATYDEALAAWAKDNDVRSQHVPLDCEHPAHVYTLVVPTAEDRTDLIAHLRERNIVAPFHYVPLHSSPVGQLVGRTADSGCSVTEDVSDRLLRLPLHAGLRDDQVERVVEAVTEFRTSA